MKGPSSSSNKLQLAETPQHLGLNSFTGDLQPGVFCLFSCSIFLVPVAKVFWRNPYLLGILTVLFSLCGTQFVLSLEVPRPRGALRHKAQMIRKTG